MPLESLDNLYERDRPGTAVPLPAELDAVYGPLRFPPHPGRPYVLGNFVSSLDGVAAFETPGQEHGGPINDPNPHDRMLMGLLRAVADAVVVGAGTQREASSQHLWVAEYIDPSFAKSYQSLRIRLGKPGPPLNVVVTSRGEIAPGRRVFQSGEVPVLLVTSEEGARRIRQFGLPEHVQIAIAERQDRFSARSIVEAIARTQSPDLILVEGGPHLFTSFLAESLLDELFLTLSPVVAGRDGAEPRPGFVAGHEFAPEQPLWPTLTGVKRGGSHLFLRYTFPSREPNA